MIYNKKIDIPNYVRIVSDIITENGEECFLVGGSLRDYLTGNNVHDYDLCTSQSSRNTIKQCIKYNFRYTTWGIDHGSIKVYIDNNEPVDVTEFGNDPRFYDCELNEYYEKTIYDDISRRDFTMNALAYNIKENLLIDMYNGIEDIKKRNLVFVDDCRSQLNKDKFLILRALRQAITLGFTINYRDLQTIKRFSTSDNFNQITWWRRGNELRKILSVNKSDLENTIQKAYFIEFLRMIPRMIENYSLKDSDYSIIFNMDNFIDRISYILRNQNFMYLKNLILNLFEYNEEDFSNILERIEVL